MKIAIIGAGYVGLTSAVVFAKLGNSICVVDTAYDKIKMLQRGFVPFYEPHLDELIKKSLKSGRLVFQMSYAQAIQNADIVFICVGTPPLKNGEADLSHVFAAAKELTPHIKKNTIVVIKSTVPVGTAEKVHEFIKEITNARISIASCPEFLREGSALADTLHPDRIVIGADSARARRILLNVHSKLPGARVVTDIRTAEMIKYASNAFLATKISFINEIANVCEAVGANVSDVALGMGLDPRIGKAFLNPGIGYGGSCFPKDTRALNSIALLHNYDFKLLKAVIEVNRQQRRMFLKKIEHVLGGLKRKRIGVLGLAFKNSTDDVRESAGLEIVKELMHNGALVKAFDPKAMMNAKKVLPKLATVKKPEDTAANADALVILTEWPEFRELPFDIMRKNMRQPLIIDGRNLLKPEKMRSLGFNYISVGRL